MAKSFTFILKYKIFLGISWTPTTAMGTDATEQKSPNVAKQKRRESSHFNFNFGIGTEKPHLFHGQVTSSAPNLHKEKKSHVLKIEVMDIFGLLETCLIF